MTTSLRSVISSMIDEADTIDRRLRLEETYLKTTATMSSENPTNMSLYRYWCILEERVSDMRAHRDSLILSALRLLDC